MNTFSFSPANLLIANQIINKYPVKQSAILPLLDLAQRQNDGWISVCVMEYIADFLEMSYIKVHEIASFYTMFNLKPIGKYHIQVCGTTPCWLSGAQELIKTFEEKLGIKCGEVSDDKMFSLCEVECLGACIKAPIAQINDDFHENIDPKEVDKLLRDIANKS
jgi:NADH-quinone oxidoreductase subunit E